MKKNKWVKKRQQVYSALLKPFALLFVRIKFHYKYKKLKFDRKQRYFILANHQTDVDPIIALSAFGRFAYPVSTETVLSNGFVSRLLKGLFNPIPIRKGGRDASSIINMLKVSKENGDILLFPEGNRAYADFQYPIGDSLIRLIRKTNLSLMIMNIQGGNGVSPRFAHKNRKGKITCILRKTLTPEELEEYSDEDLLALIKENLKVYDSQSQQRFISNSKAEYLERMLFYCPVCHKMESLHSQGNQISCTCSLKVNFNEDLSLSSDNPLFTYTNLVDWYDDERKAVRDMEIFPEKTIFSDPDVSIFSLHLYQKRILLSKGSMNCTDQVLSIGDWSLPVTEIETASPISGTKLAVTTKKESYLICGNERFNPLKYVFLFHRLDTKVKDNDIYFPID